MSKLESQEDAFRRSSHAASDRRSSDNRKNSSTQSIAGDLPALYSIHQGQVKKITDFGAFVQLKNYPGHQGLIHKSQLSKYYTENVKDVLEEDEWIWVKVISIEVDQGKTKIALSKKYVGQGRGEDHDPNNVQLEQEQQRTRQTPDMRGRPPIITEDALANSICRKCGSKGHLLTECYNSIGEKKYELVPSESDEEDFHTASQSNHGKEERKKEKSEKKSKKEKKKKEKRHRSRSSSPEIKEVSSVADALAVMKKKARLDREEGRKKKKHSHHDRK